jgi:hypothetical protein
MTGTTAYLYVQSLSSAHSPHCPVQYRSGAPQSPCVHPPHPLAPPTLQAPKPRQTQRSSPDWPTRKRKSRQSKHYNVQAISSYADSRASRMTARRWPTQVSVRACIRARAWLALGRTPRGLLLTYYYSLPSVVSVTDLIFGGSRNVFARFLL